MPSSNNSNKGKGNVENKPVTGTDQDDDLNALEGSNKINGGDGNDVINGGDGYDFINAGDGDDVVTGGAGDDLMHGNDGFDTAVFSGSVFDYSFTSGKGNATIASGADGVDTLKHFEALQFGDYTYYIDGRNNAPFTRADTSETNEDSAVLVENLLDNDIDIDGDEFSITSIAASGSGALVTLDDAQGSVNYDPNGSFESLAVGTSTNDTFSYTVTDSNGGVRSETVTVTVTGVNDAPTLAGGSASANEDGASVSVDLSALGADIDSDNDGGSLDYSLLNAASGGSASISGTSLSFDPGSDFQSLAQGETASVDLEVEAKDNHGATATNTVAVTVTGVNDAPTLAGGSASANEDGASVSVDLSVLGADIDSDNDGGSLDYSLLNAASGGSASISGTSLSFDPGSDFQSLAQGETASVDLEVEAKDNYGATATNTVAVTVTGVNDAPVINGGDSNGAVTLTPGQTPFTVEQWTGYFGSFSQGSLQAAAAASAPNYTSTADIIDFTDDPGGFAGEIPGSSPWPAAVANGASGTSGINDHFFARITANIVITEADTYTFRTFNDDGVYLKVDNQLIINDPNQHGEQAFQSDITLSPGVYPLELFFFENGGEASLELSFKNTGGVFQHVTTEPTDSGTLQFSDVDLSDSHTINVAPVGAVQGNMTAIMGADTTGSGTGGVVSWDYQIGNDAYQSLGAGATATESFLVSVSDGKGGVAQQQVDITITGGNDNPVAADDSGSTDEDTSINITVLANDNDVDIGDVLTVSAGALSDQGAILTVNANGTINYDPSSSESLQAMNNGDSLVDTFTYTVSDGNGGNDTATVSFAVGGVTDAVVNDDGEEVSTGFENGFSGWEILGSTLIVASSTGAGNMAQLNGTGATEAEIEAFLGADISDTYAGKTGSAIMTTLSLSAGDKVSFDYFFQANDYLPFNDFAVYMGTDGSMDLLSNVAAVGNYGNSGWQTVEVEIGITGVYDIGFASVNAVDTALWPQLYVDNLTIV